MMSALRYVAPFQQLVVQRRHRSESIGRHQPVVGNLLHLCLGANHLDRRRKRLRTEIVLGMHVRRREVHRLAAGKLLGFVQHDRTIAGTHSGIDDQNGTVANDDADVGDQADVVVGDHVDVIADLLRGVLANEGIGARRLRGNMNASRQRGCGKEGDDHAHGAHYHAEACFTRSRVTLPI